MTTQAILLPAQAPRALVFELFCQVVDNFGDIGVCWRLACDLAARGHHVRLWVDDASALQWMAPQGCADVVVLPWTSQLTFDAQLLSSAPADAIMEAFGCDAAPELIAAYAGTARLEGQKNLKNEPNTVLREPVEGIRPVWLNLEYLSAEAYVERSHAMPSPVQTGPGRGSRKWFFYPGFSAKTGGLLREADLPERRRHFDRTAWLKAQGISSKDEALVSLFCYEPARLPALLHQLSRDGLDGQPVHLLVTAGRASRAVQAVAGEKTPAPCGPDQASSEAHNLLRITYLPLLSQRDFDHLLWACDLNFVRGEDSVLRALWAETPFVWHIYPQADDAHQPKLAAFLQALGAPADVQAYHAWWNAAAPGHEAPPPLSLSSWSGAIQQAAQRLRQQADLTTQLLAFVQTHMDPST